MDFRPSLRSHPLGVFYAWLSHTKHHAQTYAYAICDCKGSAFSCLHQTKSQLFFSTRHFLRQKEWKPHEVASPLYHFSYNNSQSSILKTAICHLLGSSSSMKNLSDFRRENSQHSLSLV